MNQGFIFAATTASLVLLAYLIRKSGSKPINGSYRFSRVFISMAGCGAMLFGGGLVFGLYRTLTDPASYSDMTSTNWGLFAFLLLFIFALVYYPSVRFTVASATLTYKSIWATKVIDLTRPFTLTCYPASGQYVIQQGQVKTKITGYISGWQYLLEEIEAQSTAMVKIDKK